MNGRSLILGLAACAWMVAITVVHYCSFTPLGDVLRAFLSLWRGQ